MRAAPSSFDALGADEGVSLERVLVGLDPSQRAAVLARSPTVCVLAAAGSGKTRVLTRRVARRVLDGSAPANHSLVLTFTRKAATELRQRLRDLGVGGDVTTGTFHGIAYAELRKRWAAQGRAAPTVASNPRRLVELVLEDLRVARSVSPRAVLTEIAWAKCRNIRPDRYQEEVQRAGHRPRMSPGQVARIYRAYEELKQRRRVLDYDDLLLQMIDAMARDRKFAEAQRWRFRHFSVDEFQDLNAAQFQLLRAWMGGRDDLFVVGDPSQAIYGWNGADAQYLHQVERHFPDAEVLRLDVNYRSSTAVLAAANAVLPAAGASSPEQPPEGMLLHGDPPTVRRFEDDQQEALSVAYLVRQAHQRARRWSDIAVLLRTNAQRLAFEHAFEVYGIPFRSSGGAAWLYRTEVRAALELLRESPKVPLLQRQADVEQMVVEAAAADRPSLEELRAAVAHCIGDDPSMTVASFLAWLEVASRFDGPSEDGGSAVTLTTFHRAKGLEWPVVFLAGIEAGFVPLGDPSGDQLEEERRLFYVAITRAREELHCSWAARRASGERVLERDPSPWLAPIEELASGATLAHVPHQPVQASLGDARAALVDRCGEEAPSEPADVVALRERLQRWRASQAKLLRSRPELVLPDAALAAVLAARPRTEQDLAQVDGIGPLRARSMAPCLDVVVA